MIPQFLRKTLCSQIKRAHGTTATQHTKPTTEGQVSGQNRSDALVNEVLAMKRRSGWLEAIDTAGRESCRLTPCEWHTFVIAISQVFLDDYNTSYIHAETRRIHAAHRLGYWLTRLPISTDRTEATIRRELRNLTRLRANPEALNVPRSHNKLAVCTYGAMAMKSMQLGEFHHCGKPGDPGWRVRRQLIVEYLQQREYDFVALQHCHYQRNGPYNAVEWFRSGLEKLGLRYGVLNYPYGPNAPYEGDSAPLFYNADKWTQISAEPHVVHFRTEIPKHSQIPRFKGRSFIWGQFHSAELQMTVYIYHVHLPHKRTPVADEHRYNLLRELFDHIEARDDEHPVIVLGDFNTIEVPDSKADILIKSMANPPPSAPRLVDTCLIADPTLEAASRTQHNFKDVHDIRTGNRRNSRILLADRSRLTIDTAGIVPLVVEDAVPSYAHPVETILDVQDAL